jgi:DNA invertase Pin-like site-specific DNA recombinase/DNA-binding transcriptional regulator YdaS (Cro superfamily)
VEFRGANPKITPRHLSLLAVIYVRQSTERQVIENRGSALYQRKFVELARHYGWPDDLIVINDQDLGVSGRSTAGREGYKQLRQQIFEGQVGAVFCAEESRLDRDFSSFAQLVKLSAACNTLIIDEKGVYDPNNDNDWTFLGFTGVLNEAERRRMVQRSIAATRTLAEKRELRLMPPTGYVYDNGRLIIDPDEKVADALCFFFDSFELYGSALMVIKRFNRNGRLFPTRAKGSGPNRPVTWGEISIHRALDVLRNPTYAGAYVFGLTKAVYEPLGPDTTEHKKRRVRIDLDSGKVLLIHSAHKGYITWEQFTRNQQRLADNRVSFSTGTGGAIRNNQVLLQGLIRCGHCGRGMYTHYARRKNRTEIDYRCNGEVRNFGKDNCVRMVAHQLDDAVTAALIEAVNPAQLQLTLLGLDQAAAEARVIDRHQIKAIERAQAEVAEAKLRFESIDPRHTLVAELYQEQLQAKMIAVRRLETERERQAQAATRQLPTDVRQSVLALAQDVRQLWASNAVTHVERKLVVRCLITKVTIKKRAGTMYKDVVIHWVTGASTPLVLFDARYHRPEAVALIRQLAPDHTIRQIIDRLDQAGYKMRNGKRFNPGSIHSYCSKHRIKLGCLELHRGSDEPRGDGRYSTGALAKLLGVSDGTVHRWCEEGKLDYVRSVPHGPRWIKLSPEDIARLQSKCRQGGQ